MQKRFVVLVFFGISIGLVWTGQTVVRPNKETCHSTLYVLHHIFHFPFFSLYYDFILRLLFLGIFVTSFASFLLFFLSGIRLMTLGEEAS